MHIHYPSTTSTLSRRQYHHHQQQQHNKIILIYLFIALSVAPPVTTARDINRLINFNPPTLIDQILSNYVGHEKMDYFYS